MHADKQERIEKALGYRFRDPVLLEEALTHISYTNENRGVRNNERMEFLGDAVLQIVVSRLLYDRYPQESEGALSLYRQHLVCRETLARIGQGLDLGDALLLGNGEERQGGRRKPSLLSNAMEALTAAVYLDAADGCEGTVSDVLQRLLKHDIESCERLRGGDYKTRLQQLVEQDGSELLDYRVLSVEGPVHHPLYRVEALLNSNVIGRGSGGSKQEAEQEAAREALSYFETRI